MEPTHERVTKQTPADTLKQDQFFADVLKNIPWADPLLNDLARHHEPSFQAETRVAHIAGGLASALALSPEDTLVVEQAALLHDSGKVAVPSEILQKQGPLDEQEWQAMRQHPDAGAAKVMGENTDIAMLIRLHHSFQGERSYPPGARSDVPERLQFLAALVSIADVTEAAMSRLSEGGPMNEDRAQIRLSQQFASEPVLQMEVAKRTMTLETLFQKAIAAYPHSEPPNGMYD